MTEVDFSSVENAEAWFAAQDIHIRCSMSGRAALRVLASVNPTLTGELETLVLACLRATLTSIGRGAGKSTDINWDLVAFSAADNANSARRTRPGLAAFNSAAAKCAALSAHSAHSDAYSAHSALTAAATAVPAQTANSAALIDAYSLSSTSNDTIQLYFKPAWGGVELPNKVRVNHEIFLERLSAEQKWDFWHDWYFAMWNGKFFDWRLVFEVVAIDDTIWHRGPEAVAAEIERIQARLALQNEISALRDEVLKLRQNQATPATGHNQGPPIDDSEIHLRESFDLVWPILDALEEEAAQHSPDISRLKALALRLWEIAKTAATYCGAKLDIALAKAAETVGETGTKWAVRASVATYASTNEGLQSVAKLAWKFARTLSGS